MITYAYRCEKCNARSERSFPFVPPEATHLAGACEAPLADKDICGGDLRKVPAWNGAHRVPGGARDRKA